MQQWRQEANGQALEEARDQAVQGLQQAAAGQLQQLQQQLKNDRVQQALQAGDAAAAALAVREGWSGVEQVEVLAADLANAYGDPAAFGYARLALLEAVLAEAKPACAWSATAVATAWAWPRRCSWAAWGRPSSMCANRCCG